MIGAQASACVVDIEGVGRATARPALGQLAGAGGMVDRLTPLLLEIDQFLMGESKVHATLVRIAQRLDELGVDFALAGGLAVGVRGHVRLTIDVDILVTAEGLERFKARWLGRGYLERTPGSRGVRDTETGVSVDFLVAGDFPGDGRPKAVRFPNPASILTTDTSLRVLDLRTLVELKLASGLSAPDRLQDLADVVALVRVNQLAENFGEQLDPSVRDKYRELWFAAQLPSGPDRRG